MTSNDVSVTGDGTAVLSAGDRSSAKSPGYSDLTAPVPVHPRWEPLAEPKTIDDVLRGIDQVLDWSIKEKSTIGYFAVLYKRVTLGIRQAINDGEFDDGARIERLDVAFARRYFNALNAYFCPDQYDGLTLPWEVAFVEDPNGQATILQHMMAGLNAHITFDLGIALTHIMPNSLNTMENDFQHAGDVLCRQIPDVLEFVVRLSPRVRWILRAKPIVRRRTEKVVKKLRTSAFRFASGMEMDPESARETEVNKACWTAALGSWYLQPKQGLGRFLLTPMPGLVRFIAERESRDVAYNIRVLQEVCGWCAKSWK